MTKPGEDIHPALPDSSLLAVKQDAWPGAMLTCQEVCRCSKLLRQMQSGSAPTRCSASTRCTTWHSWWVHLHPQPFLG